MSKFNGFSPSEENVLLSKGYHIITKIGYGSYSQVYTVVQDQKNYYAPGLHRKTTIACKVVDSSKTPSNFVQKFFPRELEVLVRIRHPYVVNTHCIFQRRKKYFIFMRLCEGGDLLDYIIANGELSESRARLWTNQVALAVNYIHRLNIAHRDIKCENILITINNNVKLADFGFARYVVTHEGKAILSRTFCGSLPYTAPEILQGNAYDAKKADMWSVGVVIFVMLNKTLPFQSQSAKVMLELQQQNTPLKFRQKMINQTSDLVRWSINQIIVLDPSKRWNIADLIQSKWLNSGRSRIANEFMQKQQYPQETRSRHEVLKVINEAAENAAHNTTKVTVIKNDNATRSADSLE